MEKMTQSTLDPIKPLYGARLEMLQKLMEEFANTTKEEYGKRQPGERGMYEIQRKASLLERLESRKDKLWRLLWKKTELALKWDSRNPDELDLTELRKWFKVRSLYYGYNYPV